MIAVFALSALFLFASCGGSGAQTHELEASAAEILTVYGEDEAAGNEKYEGKWLKINGLISEIGQDLEKEETFVLISAADFDFQGLQCYFKDKVAAENLKEGSEVSIVGKCKGLRGFNIVLENCSQAN